MQDYPKSIRKLLREYLGKFYQSLRERNELRMPE
jgi:hypothetical protein